MLGPDDVGHRVVVRRVVGRRDNRPLFSDALGELTAVTDADLTVATAAGPTTISRESVVAAKRVPSRPVTRRAVAALEQAANDAWPAPVQERLGGWLLRAADGWSWRANSALPLGDPGLPLAAALDRVQRWYAGHGLPARMSVPLPLAMRLDRALDGRGWTRRSPVLVQTTSVASLRTGPLVGPGEGSDRPAGLEITTEPTGQWLALAGGSRHLTGRPLPAAAYHVLTGGGCPVAFAHQYDGSGALVAAGRGAVTGAGRWLGISRVTVTPAARGRGLARRIVAALAAWAGAHRATDAFLQVEEDNPAAVSLYATLGFTTHHTYVAREPPPAPTS